MRICSALYCRENCADNMSDQKSVRVPTIRDVFAYSGAQFTVYAPRCARTAGEWRRRSSTANKMWLGLLTDGHPGMKPEVLLAVAVGRCAKKPCSESWAPARRKSVCSRCAFARSTRICNKMFMGSGNALTIMHTRTRFDWDDSYECVRLAGKWRCNEARVCSLQICASVCGMTAIIVLTITRRQAVYHIS